MPNTGEKLAGGVSGLRLWNSLGVVRDNLAGRLGFYLKLLTSLFFFLFEIQIVLLCLLNNFARLLGVCLKMKSLCECQL